MYGLEPRLGALNLVLPSYVHRSAIWPARRELGRRRIGRSCMGADGPAVVRAGSKSGMSQMRVIRPPMRVLFVDPDSAGAEPLARALRSQHTVTIVGSAHAAMAQMEQQAPDLIVAELNLPDAD